MMLWFVSYSVRETPVLVRLGTSLYDAASYLGD